MLAAMILEPFRPASYCRQPTIFTRPYTIKYGDTTTPIFGDRALSLYLGFAPSQRRKAIHLALVDRYVFDLAALYFDRGLAT